MKESRAQNACCFVQCCAFVPVLFFAFSLSQLLILVFLMLANYCCDSLALFFILLPRNPLGQPFSSNVATFTCSNLWFSTFFLYSLAYPFFLSLAHYYHHISLCTFSPMKAHAVKPSVNNPEKMNSK